MTEYRLFIDENGDNNLTKIDKNFPIFCLTCCVFEKDYYHNIARNEIDSFKNKFWGRTNIILHSREIRKQEGDFKFLNDEKLRSFFYESLDELIVSLDFSIISTVILKNEHKARYKDPYPPYNLALQFIMERFCFSSNRKSNCTGYILAESRGIKEDKQIKQAYRNLQKNGNQYDNYFINLTSIQTEKKNKNIAGLQIADLVSYPIASKVLRPKKENPAWDLIYKKIQSQNGVGVMGYGLKIFPGPSEEHKVYIK